MREGKKDFDKEILVEKSGARIFKTKKIGSKAAYFTPPIDRGRREREGEKKKRISPPKFAWGLETSKRNVPPAQPQLKQNSVRRPKISESFLQLDQRTSFLCCLSQLPSAEAG